MRWFFLLDLFLCSMFFGMGCAEETLCCRDAENICIGACENEGYVSEQCPEVVANNLEITRGIVLPPEKYCERSKCRYQTVVVPFAIVENTVRFCEDLILDLGEESSRENGIQFPRGKSCVVVDRADISENGSVECRWQYVCPEKSEQGKLCEELDQSSETNVSPLSEPFEDSLSETTSGRALENNDPNTNVVESHSETDGTNENGADILHRSICENCTSECHHKEDCNTYSKELLYDCPSHKIAAIVDSCLKNACVHSFDVETSSEDMNCESSSLSERKDFCWTVATDCWNLGTGDDSRSEMGPKEDCLVLENSHCMHNSVICSFHMKNCLSLCEKRKNCPVYLPGSLALESPLVPPPPPSIAPPPHPPHHSPKTTTASLSPIQILNLVPTDPCEECVPACNASSDCPNLVNDLFLQCSPDYMFTSLDQFCSERDGVCSYVTFMTVPECYSDEDAWWNCHMAQSDCFSVEGPCLTLESAICLRRSQNVNVAKRFFPDRRTDGICVWKMDKCATFPPTPPPSQLPCTEEEEVEVFSHTDCNVTFLKSGLYRITFESGVRMRNGTAVVGSFDNFNSSDFRQWGNCDTRATDMVSNWASLFVQQNTPNVNGWIQNYTQDALPPPQDLSQYYLEIDFVALALGCKDFFNQSVFSFEELENAFRLTGSLYIVSFEPVNVSDESEGVKRITTNVCDLNITLENEDSVTTEVIIGSVNFSFSVLSTLIDDCCRTYVEIETCIDPSGSVYLGNGAEGCPPRISFPPVNFTKGQLLNWCDFRCEAKRKTCFQQCVEAINNNNNNNISEMDCEIFCNASSLACQQNCSVEISERHCQRIVANNLSLTHGIILGNGFESIEPPGESELCCQLWAFLWTEDPPPPSIMALLQFEWDIVNWPNVNVTKREPGVSAQLEILSTNTCQGRNIKRLEINETVRVCLEIYLDEHFQIRYDPLIHTILHDCDRIYFRVFTCDEQGSLLSLANKTLLVTEGIQCFESLTSGQPLVNPDPVDPFNTGCQAPDIEEIFTFLNLSEQADPPRFGGDRYMTKIVSVPGQTDDEVYICTKARTTFITRPSLYQLFWKIVSTSHHSHVNHRRAQRTPTVHYFSPLSFLPSHQKEPFHMFRGDKSPHLPVTSQFLVDCPLNWRYSRQYGRCIKMRSEMVNHRHRKSH